MPDINLLGSQSQGSNSVNNSVIFRVLGRLFTLLLVVVVIGYIGLFVMQYLDKKTTAKAQAQIDKLQAQAIANKDRNELVTRQEQIQQLDVLINKHVYWSYLLPELARITLKSAKYSEISANDKGKLELGVLLPSYGDVEKFMQIFDLPQYNQQFSNVRIVGIDNTQNGTAIQTKLRLELTFNPSFLKDPDLVKSQL